MISLVGICKPSFVPLRGSLLLSFCFFPLLCYLKVMLWSVFWGAGRVCYILCSIRVNMAPNGRVEGCNYCDFGSLPSPFSSLYFFFSTGRSCSSVGYLWSWILTDGYLWFLRLNLCFSASNTKGVWRPMRSKKFSQCFATFCHFMQGCIIIKLLGIVPFKIVNMIKYKFTRHLKKNTTAIKSPFMKHIYSFCWHYQEHCNGFGFVTVCW